MSISRILTKGLHLAQLSIEHPRSFFKRLKGVPLTMFHDLDRPWLKKIDVRTVIDVGANTGQFTKVIHEVFPQAAIYSFEPLPDCFKKLQALKKKIPTLEAFNYAVGEKNGPVEFHRSASSSSSSLLEIDQRHLEEFPFSAEDEVIKVEMIRLDDIFDRLNLQVEKDLLLKIDAEGYEDKVLQGGHKILERTRLLILETSYIELYKGQALFDDIYGYVTARGFKYTGNLSELRSPTDGSILQTDSVFIRAG